MRGIESIREKSVKVNKLMVFNGFVEFLRDRW